MDETLNNARRQLIERRSKHGIGVRANDLQAIWGQLFRAPRADQKSHITTGRGKSAVEVAAEGPSSGLYPVQFADLELTSRPYFDNVGIMKSGDVVVGLSALAQESRLALFRLLVKRGPEGFTPSQLADKLDVLGPTLSFHLKELQRAGLIEARREGRFLFYSPNFPRMNELIGFLTDNCCVLADKHCGPTCGIPAAEATQSKRRRA